MESINSPVALDLDVYGVDEAFEEEVVLRDFFTNRLWTGLRLSRGRLFIDVSIGFGTHVLLNLVVSCIKRIIERAEVFTQAGSLRDREVEPPAFKLLVCLYGLVLTIDELVLRELIHQGFGLEDGNGVVQKVVRHFLAGIVFAKLYSSSLIGRVSVFKELSTILFGCALAFLRSSTGNQVAPTILYVLDILKNIRELGVLQKV